MSSESQFGTLIGYVHRRTRFFQMAFQTTCKSFPEQYGLQKCGFYNTKCHFRLGFFIPGFFIPGLVIFSLIFHLHYISGLPVTEEQLKEAATQSGVLNVPDDCLRPEV